MGILKSAGLFLTQCLLLFKLQPNAFPTEPAKVAYTISLLSSKAKLWRTAEWESDSAISGSFPDFSDEFKRVSDPVGHEREAARK